LRIFLIIFLLLAFRVGAAEPAASPRLLVRSWQSQDGLPGNVVRSIVQSDDGYLWVATAEGVARFDGVDFEVIEPEGEQRRNRFSFLRLFATFGNQVWATTHQGGLFRAGKGRLHQIVDNIRGPAPPLVTQVIASGNGLVYFKRGEEYKSVDADGLVDDIMPTPEMLEAFEKASRKDLESGRVTGADGILHLRDRLGRDWTAGLAGEMRVSAPGDGEVHVQLPQGGHAFPVSQMLEDMEGNIWAASPLNGLVSVRQARIEVLDVNEGQSERAVSAVFQDRAGVWWIANRRGGLSQWSPSGTRHLDLAPSRLSRPAAALFEDRESRMWVASRDGSVFRYENGLFQAQYTKTQVPSKVRSITQDPEGTLWFAGAQGLASQTGEGIRTYGKPQGVGDLDLTVVQNFPGGRVIAGGATGTVLLGGQDGFQVVGRPEDLEYQWISGILPVSATETWFSTLGGGLYLWNGSKWFSFDADEGLPDSRLTCVVDDGLGNLWMGSLGGIIRANRKELLDHAARPASRVRWLCLDHTDGMPSRECIGGFQPAGWLGRDGALWFPTGGGIARVRPDRVTPNAVPPPVYLQKTRANGVAHGSGDGPVRTEPGRARLEFSFVGIGLGAPEKITYRARLSGLDETWRELGSQRVAAFEAVPPGKYTFEVMAVNGDGLRSVSPARIGVIIEPHFWETVWFFVGATALVLSTAVGIGWLAARVRMKNRIQALKLRNAREGERSRIARDLHDDLGASITEISILAALAAEDAGEGPLHGPLNQLSVKAKHVVGSLDEIVWAVNPREDTLRSLVDYLTAFAHEFLDIARIPLRLDVIREVPEIPLGTTRRHAVFLAARESLNNIVKHSGATEVTLAISLSEDVLEIRIGDNGRGFEPDYAAGGNGLENLKQRMAEAGGDCRLETRRYQGTTVFLTLPLIAATKPVS